jgi:hypothetical protein
VEFRYLLILARPLHYIIADCGGNMAKILDDATAREMDVREDTAKAYRGVYWAFLSIAAFILIAAILFFGGFLSAVTDTSPKAPPVGPSQDASGR